MIVGSVRIERLLVIITALPHENRMEKLKRSLVNGDIVRYYHIKPLNSVKLYGTYDFGVLIKIMTVSWDF